MQRLVDAAAEYCGSEHFLLLDENLKQQAEPLLEHWCRQLGDDPTVRDVTRSLEEVAHLDLPLSVRQAFPQLLDEFLEYAASHAPVPEVEGWRRAIARASTEYLASFREDGTVRGQTVRHPVAAVGRNDPCPCGSGKKFKKCCMTR